MIKEATLILFKVAYAASLILTAAKTFDRVLSNFGPEITFYKLGLNYSRASNFTQYNTTSFAECKVFFRVATVIITAFAEKQDNGVVLCTCFQTPIYYLPSVLQEEKPSFAFYKEQPNPSPLTYSTELIFLQTNGKFYKRLSGSTMASYFLKCNTTYANGRIARPKTKVDIDSVTALSFYPNYYDYYLIDLWRSSQTPYALVWGDGTLLNVTDAAKYLIYQQEYLKDQSSCCYAYQYYSRQVLWIEPTSSYGYGICEIDPFGGH